MIVELSAPLGALGLFERSLPDGAKAAFEQQAAVFGSTRPALRVPDGLDGAPRAQLEGSAAIDDLRVLSESDEGSLLAFEWVRPRPAILVAVADVEGSLLSAVAVEDTWRFRLRVPDQGLASRLFEVHDDATNLVSVGLVQQDESAATEPADALTRPQREALERAIEGGYFQVPRKANIADLAADLDISDTAVSQRLRRGLSTVIRSSGSVAGQRVDSEVGDH